MEAGNEEFEKGAYAAALASYTRAYALVPSPNLLFNLAQAHRNLGHDVDAATFYERFVREAKDAPPAVRREAEEHLEALDARLARLMVIATSGATAISRPIELTVDGDAGPGNVADRGKPTLATLPLVLRVLPGSHVLAARPSSDLPWAEERVVVRAGEVRQVSFAFVSLSASAPASSSRVAPTTVATASTSALAFCLRADLDPTLAGAGWTGALMWSWRRRIGLSGGGFVWPVKDGAAVWGGLLGLRWSPWQTSGRPFIRPYVQIEGLVHGHAGAHPGARAALGLGAVAVDHVEVSAGGAFYWVSQDARERAIGDTSFGSAFVEVALF